MGYYKFVLWRIKKGGVAVGKDKPVREVFIVQIMNNQNYTWQGTITWAEEHRTEQFRSTLELIKLIDSAITTGSSGDKDE